MIYLKEEENKDLTPQNARAKDKHNNVNTGKDPWEQLAFAIVLAAIYDYRAVLKEYRRNPHPAQKTMEAEADCLDFFYSNWFSCLTRLNPDNLVDTLQEEAKRNDR